MRQEQRAILSLRVCCCLLLSVQSNWQPFQSLRAWVHYSSLQNRCSSQKQKQSILSVVSNTCSQITLCSRWGKLRTPVRVQNSGKIGEKLFSETDLGKTWLEMFLLRLSPLQFILLQFDCTNTLNDQLLERVTVQMEPSDAYDVICCIPAPSLPYNQPGMCYTLVQMPQDDPTAGKDCEGINKLWGGKKKAFWEQVLERSGCGIWWVHTEVLALFFWCVSLAVIYAALMFVQNSVHAFELIS